MELRTDAPSRQCTAVQDSRNHNDSANDEWGRNYLRAAERDAVGRISAERAQTLFDHVPHVYWTRRL